jgi:hypothetical protein
MSVHRLLATGALTGRTAAASPSGSGARFWVRRRWATAAVWALLGVAGASAQEVPLPADLQAKLILNVLSFDHNLAARAGDQVTIGILVQRHFRASRDAGEELRAALAGMPSTIPAVRVVVLDAESAEVTDLLERHQVEVLYVTPLRALPVEEVAQAARALQVRTFTGVAEYVRRGIAAGLGLRNRRPEVLINLPAARAEGASYSSQLLELARLVP